MILHLHFGRFACWSLLALVVTGCAPECSYAGSLGYRNDTDAPIIVQGFSIINGRIFQGKPHTLQPGELCWDLGVTPGNKLLVVADAKQPTRVLFREIIGFTGTELFLSVQSAKPAPAKKNDAGQPDARPKKALPSQVKLVPVMAPASPPIMIPGTKTSDQTPPMKPPPKKRGN